MHSWIFHSSNFRSSGAVVKVLHSSPIPLHGPTAAKQQSSVDQPMAAGLKHIGLVVEGVVAQQDDG